jgi:hypothetical protein
MPFLSFVTRPAVGGLADRCVASGCANDVIHVTSVCEMT